MFEAKKSRSTNFHTRNDFTISFCGDFLFLPTECNLFLRVPSARIFLIFPVLHYNFCVRGIGWGTAIQPGRSRVRFPILSLEIFHWHNPSGRTVALGVDSVSNRNEYQDYFMGVKAAGMYGWQPYHLRVPNVLKSGILNLLETSGPLQPCNGVALPFYTIILDQPRGLVVRVSDY